MNFDARLQFILLSLQDRAWDVIIFTETWREPVREVFVTDFGRTWFGSGGVRGARGVGILLNKRWSYKSFTAISSRVCALDLRLGNHPLRIIGAYMPHGGHDDDDVEVVYNQLEDLLRDT